MSPKAECLDTDDGGTHGPLRQDDLPELFRSHANGLHAEVDSFAAEIETGEGPTVERLNAVRTELIELQAAVEDLGSSLCDDADPWEYVDEYLPSR